MIVLYLTLTAATICLVLVGAALAAIVRVQARSYRFAAVTDLIIDTRTIRTESILIN